MHINQGEGGEQGDPPMPLLFSLGQHGAPESVHRTLRDGERMLAETDNIHIVTSPNRVRVVIASLQEQLFHARIRGGKTQVWNGAGIRPVACDVFEQIAKRENPHMVVWMGSVLGTPLGHPEFVASHLEHIAEEHRMLLERIPAIQDVQSAWLILLHCATARPNYSLRPALVRRFAENHDARLWRCLCQILHIPEGQCEATARTTNTMPLVLGGMGLRSAMRTSLPAYWASWGDCLHMVHQKHPDVARVLVDHLDAAVACARELERVQGFHPPSWTTLAFGARPPPP